MPTKLLLAKENFVTSNQISKEISSLATKVLIMSKKRVFFVKDPHMVCGYYLLTGERGTEGRCGSLRSSWIPAGVIPTD